MSNNDLIRAFYKSFRSGDYAAFAELCDPDIEWVQNEGFPYGGRHQGPLAVVEGVFRRLSSHWEAWGFDLREILDAGDSVVVLGDYTGRHKQTGKTFMAAAAHVLDLKAGRVWRFRQYTDTALIREATVAQSGHR